MKGINEKKNGLIETQKCRLFINFLCQIWKSLLNCNMKLKKLKKLNFVLTSIPYIFVSHIKHFMTQIVFEYICLNSIFEKIKKNSKSWYNIIWKSGIEMHYTHIRSMLDMRCPGWMQGKKYNVLSYYTRYLEWDCYYHVFKRLFHNLLYFKRRTSWIK